LGETFNPLDVPLCHCLSLSVLRHMSMRDVSMRMYAADDWPVTESDPS